MHCASLTPEWQGALTRVAGRGTSGFAARYRCDYRVDTSGTLFENGDAIGTFADAVAGGQWLATRVESKVCEPALLSGWSGFRGALLTHASSPTTGVAVIGTHCGAAVRSLLDERWHIEGRDLLLHKDGLALGVDPEATGRTLRVACIVATDEARSSELVEAGTLTLIEPLVAASSRFAESESELVRRVIGLARTARGWVVRSPSAESAASIVARLEPVLAVADIGL